jgi:hypothetical protein
MLILGIGESSDPFLPSQFVERLVHERGWRGHRLYRELLCSTNKPIHWNWFLCKLFKVDVRVVRAQECPRIGLDWALDVFTMNHFAQARRSRTCDMHPFITPFKTALLVRPAFSLTNTAGVVQETKVDLYVRDIFDDLRF